MALLEVKEYDRKIYESELRDFLPEKMIDIHTHIWLERLFRKAKEMAAENRTVTWPSLVARENSVEELEETYRLMFPGKAVTPLMFATARDKEMSELNRYVKEKAKETSYPALYFSRPEESAEELEHAIRDGGFLGIKSYLSLSAGYLPTKEIRIFDFFPKHQLEKMNEMKAIVMLHIPRDGRLKDPVNLAQIKEIAREFPNVKLIVAHIGRAYVPDDIGNAFEELAECKDIFFDFSANCCEYAMTRLLEAVEPKRILFGSDLPILRMKTRRIEENGTYINLVPPGIYSGAAKDPHLREVSAEEAETITFFMYEELLAFKRAAQKAGLTAADVEDVFYRNAKNLLDNARRDIYGR